ncbi:MAG: DUF3168 domain-containing protein [Erythrobacter sp.]
MENLLRATLINWLRSDPALAGINAIEEESPLAVSPPWLGLAASGSIDWSTKDRRGLEVRLAMELETRTDDPIEDAEIVQAIETRIANLPRSQDGFELASSQFQRARSERRPNNLRGVLLEYRFRILDPDTE